MSLYWIKDCAGMGRLAVAPRPRGGDWLSDEMKQWRSDGVDVVVSAMETSEMVELELTQEEAAAKSAGMGFMRFPIPDRGTPESIRDLSAFVGKALNPLDADKAVVVHCRAGLGRSAILSACMLIARGVSFADAIERVSDARGCTVPETVAQRQCIGEYARQRRISDHFDSGKAGNASK